MGINFAAASTAGLNNPGTEIITLVKDGSGNFINPPSYDKMRAYLSSGEVPMLFVTAVGGETGSLYQLDEYSETENKIRFSNSTNAIEFCAGAVAPVEAVSVQPNWNQNDSTAADYVKNRPFYTGDSVETILVKDINVSFSNPSEGIYYGSIPTTIELIAGDTYKVSWDGATYECVCELIRGQPAIGNPSIIGAGADTGEPFLILPLADNQGTEVYTLDTSTHTISISGFAQEVVKIDEKYLPKASENSYGVIKTAAIVSVYNFPSQAQHDPMVDAITAFRTGNANIVWAGVNLINASYNSSDDTISVTFANEPLRTQTFSNTGGLYNRKLGKSTYGELQGSRIRITNDNNVYAALEVEGESPNVTLSTGANRIAINGAWGMSTTEVILKSSTAGSSKTFKITVDDSGTISATAVI